MYCPNCGSENLDDARVCTSCGAEIPEKKKEAQTPAQALAAKLPKVSNATIIKVFAVAVLAIILIAIIAGFSGGRSGDYTFVKQEVQVLYNDGKSTVFVNAKALKTTIDGTAAVVQSSMDNSISLIKAVADGDSCYYTLNGKKLVKISGSEDWKSATMSSTGAGIAYTVDDDGETVLSLYNVSKKKSTKVESASRFSNIELAPDGKSLIYDRRNDDGDTVAYFFDGKKNVKLGTSVTPIGLSNSGKYIYAATTKDDGETILSLYNKKGEKKSKIGAISGSVTFNEDHTQLLYNNDGKRYISVNGKEGVKFFKKSGVSPICPADTKAGADGTYPVDNFFNLYYFCDSSIYQVKKNYDNTVKLANKVVYGILSEDASTIHYMDTNGDVRMVKTSWGEKGPDKAVTIAENVTEFVVTSDCKRIYYREKDELYSAKASNGKSKRRVSDDVSAIRLGKGDILYMKKDNDLYYCSNGKSAKLAQGGLDEWDLGYLGYLYVKSDDALYCTTGSKKPKKIFKLD